MPVNLSYSGNAGGLPGITNNPNAYYRAHGAAGWQDWLDSGKIRNNPFGKYADKPAYWSKGEPLGRYTSRSGGTHILESTSKRIFPTTAFHGGDLGKYNAFKVFEKTPSGYKMIYHNQPWKQIAKTAGRSALGTIGSVIAGDMMFPDEANAYTLQEQAILNRASNLHGSYGASGSW